MPATKDQHVAWIDFHEKVTQVSQRIKNTVDIIKARQAAKIPLTDEEFETIKKIRQAAIDTVRRAQDEYFAEMEGHK